ncbi:hypothetical protein H257_15243 [Aphanomyces astaci]|uniref:Crinkler effector protein N-terminal domain-containing protein n=1 Tax=Aphanomyces astaci TaxID=112090 RepID=W4FN05_APHAT|nr:hypothetical protein H257_15243 [Aphanomyces astaci]ETV68892.1 hypothetical protein H257_15243 [Aphanomyces astaci]RQM30757.1 hypothetical protein B5M09_013098 [Aphanomyces astaci]|eukprot:XP_009841569.1 hypothetical protein H257_15243 [Aphanomyces astaci]
MLHLRCVVVGKGHPFSVAIASNASVRELKTKVFGENLHMTTSVADDLQLYRVDGLEEGDDGQVLHHGNFVDMTLASLSGFGDDKTNMPATSFLSRWFNTADVAVSARQIHVVVSSFDDLGDQTRWTELNDVLPRRKALRHRGVDSAAISDVSWSDVRAVFDKYTIKQEFPRQAIPAQAMDALDIYLKMIAMSFGPIDASSSDATTRKYFITPIFLHVASAAGANMVLDEEVRGMRVRMHGRLDFVLVRGVTRICLVQTTDGDMTQAMADVLLACEAVADAEDAAVVYGIATDCLSWVFVKRERSHILTAEMSVQVGDDRHLPPESVQRVAETIHAMLMVMN